MPIISSQDAPVFSLGQIVFTGLASPSRGSSDNAVWKITVAPGTQSEGTHQLTREEVFVALSGSATVLLGGDACLLNAGSALVVPPATDFSLSNLGAVPFEAVVVLPVGGQAVIEGQAPFVPPWAQ